jgi:thiol-disulfide isomerase/thioredoxin
MLDQTGKLMHSLCFFCVLIYSILFFSCTKKENLDEEIRTSSVAQTETDVSAEVSVSVLDADGYTSFMDQYRGKILFVNVWATWCLPCKEEFPDLVKLADIYHSTDVAIIGLSVDYPDEIENKVKPFLRTQNASFPNYVQNFKRAEDLINSFNKQWRGSVPATFIYDKQGNQKYFLLGKHTFDEFKEKIESIRSRG